MTIVIPRAQLTDAIEQLFHLGRVQTGGRLVDHQQAREVMSARASSSIRRSP
jgi:hypothetical protein